MVLKQINPPLDGLNDEAAAWVARLSSDRVSSNDREDFALWLSRSPAHRSAMDQALELWSDLGVVSLWDLDVEKAEQQWSDDVAETAPADSLPAAARPIRRRGAVAAALAVAAGVFAFALIPFDGSFNSRSDGYQTAVGEQLTVNLDDGSRLMLNTDSGVEVDFGSANRRLEISRGEAFFNVAHDAERPFVVTVGDIQVTALGTAFNIFRGEEQIDVTVTEGVVRVSETNVASAAVPDTRIVHADMSVTISSNGLSQPRPVDVGRITAWQDGRLPADGMNLAQLVTEIQRYHARDILIGDPDLAVRTVSGVFDLSRPDSIVKALEHSLEIRAVDLADGSVMLIDNPR